MLQLLHRHKGSVTILLCVIMIPVLAFSFGLLDICKIMVAKDAVTGTTNLALNAGLTSYDKVLKDMYGILATSKTNEQLSEKMSKYYIASLNSSGIEGVDESWVKGIMSDLVGNSVDNETLENNQNFMKVTPVANADGKYITATKLLSSAASNPEVLERQIIEHMKYRAPVNLAVGMLEKLNAMKDISNMTNAQNEKIQFEKKLNKINNAAIDLYTMIMVFFHNNKRMENPEIGDFHTVYDREKSEIIAQYQYMGSTKFSVQDCENTVKNLVLDMEEAALRVAMYAPYGDAMLSGSLSYAMDSWTDTQINSVALTDDESEDELGTALQAATKKLYNSNIPRYNKVTSYRSSASDSLIVNGKVDYGYAYELYYTALAVSPAFKNTVDVSRYDYVDEAKGFALDYWLFLNEYAAMERIVEEYEKDYEDKQEKVDDLNDQLNDAKDAKNPSENKIKKLEQDILEAEKERDEAKKKYDDFAKLLREGDVPKVKSELDSLCRTVKNSVEKQFVQAQTDYERAAKSIGEIYLAISKQYLILREITKENGLLDDFASVVKAARDQSVTYQEKINNIQTTSQKNNSQLIYDNEAATLNKVDDSEISELKTALKNMMPHYLTAKLAIEKLWILGEDNSIVYTISSGSEMWSKFLTENPNEHNQFTEYFAIDNEDQVRNIVYTDRITKAVQNFIHANQNSYYHDSGGMETFLKPKLTQTEYGPVKPDGITKWTDNGSAELVCPKDISENATYQTLCDMSKALADEEGEKNQNDTSAADAIQSGAKVDADSDGGGSSIPGNEKASATSSSGVAGATGSAAATVAEATGATMTYAQIKQIQTFADYSKANSLGEVAMGSGDSTEGFSMSIDATQEDNDAIADQASSAMTAVGSMMDILGDIFSSGRDSLYVTEYLTKNFSCATTNKVGGDKKVYSEKMLNGQYYETKDKGAISIAYRSELEYILYGFDNPDANVAAAGAIIFGIRFALNFIYSYTDSEIRATTLSAATAIGGIFPFSIPLIQTVLHVALSIAESSCDLLKLMDGAAVPLFKTKSTWVCKGSNIVREVAEVVVDKVVNPTIDKATEALTTKITEWGSEIEEGALQKTTEYTDYVTQQVTAIKDEVYDSIMSPIHEVVQQVMMEYDDALHGATGTTEDKAALKTLVSETLDNATNRMRAAIGVDEANTTGETDYVKAMKVKAFEYVEANKASIVDTIYNNMKSFVDSAVGSTEDNIKNGVNMLDDKISNALSGVTDAINNAVNEFSDEVKAGISKSIEAVVTKVNEGVEMGADELKSALSNAVQGGARGHKNIEITGANAKSKDSDFALTFTYKDYLYVFTLIGSMANNNNMMMRTAQMMAANCRNNGESSDYTLNTATTLLRADVQAKVGTVFYGATFDDEKRLDFTGRRDYEFTYSSYMGY